MNSPKINSPKSKVQSSKSDLPFGESVCETPADTFAFGERFGAQLQGGEIILLSGALGAGKTLFVKGVMRSLDYDEMEVTSPSFALVNIYNARLQVFHLDLYRLDAGASAGYAVDLDEILQNETAVVLIEWAERLKDFSIPETAIRIIIAGDGDDARRISITNYKLQITD